MSTANNRDFISKIHNTWMQWMGILEKIDVLDCEETDQSLSIILPNGKLYLFNRHTGMEQLWMSSPISGGRHFICQPNKQDPSACWNAPADPVTGNAFPTDALFFNWVDTRNAEILENALNHEFEKYWGIPLNLEHRHAAFSHSP